MAICDATYLFQFILEGISCNIVLRSFITLVAYGHPNSSVKNVKVVPRNRNKTAALFWFTHTLGDNSNQFCTVTEKSIIIHPWMISFLGVFTQKHLNTHRVTCRLLCVRRKPFLSFIKTQKRSQGMEIKTQLFRITRANNNRQFMFWYKNRLIAHLEQEISRGQTKLNVQIKHRVEIPRKRQT